MCYGRKSGPDLWFLGRNDCTFQSIKNHLPTQFAYHDITCRATRSGWTDTDQFTYSDQKEQKGRVGLPRKKSASDPHSSGTLVEGGSISTAVGPADPWSITTFANYDLNCLGSALTGPPSTVLSSWSAETKNHQKAQKQRPLTSSLSLSERASTLLLSQERAGTLLPRQWTKLAPYCQDNKLQELAPDC
jgi:hypothetical protein